MARETSAPRWHLWLPAAAVAASAGMVFLAVTAARALEERHDLAVDGRISRVSHQVELGLRDQGIDEAETVLEEQLNSASGDVVALSLASPNGVEHARAGEPTDAVTSREIELFVNPRGRGRGGWQTGADGGPRRGGGGRALLTVYLSAAARHIPLAARALVPVTVAFAAALVGLALLGARLLRRQHREAEHAAAQRRLEALGRAGAGLAHQLRTPLATIKGSSQLMLEEVDEGAADREIAASVRGRIDTVLEQVERMQRMVGRLLDYARPPRAEPREIAAAAITADLGAETVVPADLRLRADPEHLREILEVLVANARSAAPAEATIEITGEAQGQQAVLRVLDRGPGPGPDPEHLFEPYVSGRADGTGLGLPIARTLAESNGGSLALRERAGGGCEAVLTLPRSVR